MRMTGPWGVGIDLAVAVAVGGFAICAMVGWVVAGSVVSAAVAACATAVAVMGAGLAFGRGDGVEAAEGGEEGVEDGHGSGFLFFSLSCMRLVF